MAKIVDGIARSTIRFSVDIKEHHKEAYEIVESQGNKNEFMVQAILKKKFKEDLFEQLRVIVREELAHISFLPQELQDNKEEQQPIANEPTQPPVEAIPTEAIDFLKSLGNSPPTEGGQNG